MKVRLAKALSNKGYCSRREAERLIQEGRVKVNGICKREVVTFVNDFDEIEVLGRDKPEDAARLWVYHKRVGLITTHNDPLNRPTVFEHFNKISNSSHVVSVGRLDINSEGLLLMTTSKALAHRLEHPSNNYRRVYKVRTFGQWNDDIFQIKHGIIIDGIRYKPVKIHVLQKGMNSWFEMTLIEGKNREIRKIFEHFGLQVNRLIRVGYGPFNLGDLGPGEAVEVNLEKVKL